MRRLLLLVLALAALAAPGSALSSPSVRYGIQDDAWLQYGPGRLQSRVAELDSLGVDVVRVTLNWRRIEPRKGVASWARADELLSALHKAGIAPLVTLYGTPGWANGGRSESWAPTSKWTFALTGTSYASPAYYAQRMFSTMHGDQILATDAQNIPTREWQPRAPRSGAATPSPRQLQQVFFNATRDSRSGIVYLKIVNEGGTAQRPPSK